MRLFCISFQDLGGKLTLFLWYWNPKENSSFIPYNIIPRWKISSSFHKYVIAERFVVNNNKYLRFVNKYSAIGILNFNNNDSKDKPIIIYNKWPITMTFRRLLEEWPLFPWLGGKIESLKNGARWKGGKVDNLNEPLISQLANMGNCPWGEGMLFPVICSRILHFSSESGFPAHIQGTHSDPVYLNFLDGTESKENTLSMICIMLFFAQIHILTEMTMKYLTL